MGIIGDFMGIIGDFIGITGDFIGIIGDFMGITGDFMGIIGDFLEIIGVKYHSLLGFIWDLYGIYMGVVHAVNQISRIPYLNVDASHPHFFS